MSGIQPIGTPGSIAYGINDAGEIVGQADYEVGYRGFLRESDGTIVDLGTLGGERSIAFDINNLGTIVGTANNAKSVFEQPFARIAGGSLIELGTLGGLGGGAFAVNDFDQIVGSATTSDGIGHAAFFSTSAPPIALDDGALSSSALDINNLGLIVGQIETSPGERHAALFQLSESPILLKDLLPADSGWTRLTRATGINDKGQIVGTGIFDGQPGSRVFLMTPIPEPTTLAILMCGIGLLWRPPCLRQSGLGNSR